MRSFKKFLRLPFLASVTTLKKLRTSLHLIFSIFLATAAFQNCGRVESLNQSSTQPSAERIRSGGIPDAHAISPVWKLAEWNGRPAESVYFDGSLSNTSGSVRLNVQEVGTPVPPLMTLEDPTFALFLTSPPQRVWANGALNSLGGPSNSPIENTVFNPRYNTIVKPELITYPAALGINESEIGNGLGDDTVALQYAIEFTKAITPATLMLNGNYKVTRVLDVSRASHLDIGGSGTIRKSGANAKISGIFRIMDGCKDVRVANLNLIGSHSSILTSDFWALPNDQVDGISIGKMPNDGMEKNVGITIENNKMTGFNHSAILVMGNLKIPASWVAAHPNWQMEHLFYWNVGNALSLANESVMIRNNEITNSSNGIFVYKNASNIVIEKNYVHNTGYDGIVLDTRAYSDANDSMPITTVRILGNLVENIGHQHSSIGILAKGKVTDVVIIRNTVRGVRAAPIAGQSIQNAVGIQAV